jgi:hypothetical protein
MAGLDAQGVHVTGGGAGSGTGTGVAIGAAGRELDASVDVVQPTVMNPSASAAASPSEVRSVRRSLSRAMAGERSSAVHSVVPVGVEEQ